ncbi:unnamed protein product, partial [Closterium sp. Yama58-4]
CTSSFAVTAWHSIASRITAALSAAPLSVACCTASSSDKDYARLDFGCIGQIKPSQLLTY